MSQCLLLKINDNNHAIKTRLYFLILYFFLELFAPLKWHHRRSSNSPVCSDRRCVFYTSHIDFGKKDGRGLISLDRIQTTLTLGPSLAVS
jgi:hypothetical protein